MTKKCVQIIIKLYKLYKVQRQVSIFEDKLKARISSWNSKFDRLANQFFDE